MASQVEQKPFDYVAEGIKFVDCDAHWSEPMDLWTSRAPAKLKDRVPKVVRGADGHDHWIIDGDKEFGRMGATVVDKNGRKYYDMRTVTTYEFAHPGATNVLDRVKVMDDYGVWSQIIYPNTAGFSANRFMRAVRDEELENFCLRAYNDAAAEMQQQSGNRLFPQGLLPVRDMKETVKEMRRAHEDLHLTGFCVSDNVASAGLPDFTDPYWAPFWDYANQTGIPISFHVGDNAIDVSVGVWESYHKLAGEDEHGRSFLGSSRQGLAMRSILADMANASIIANFLYSDLFDRYPNVKLVSVESGIGWVPYLLELADYQLDETIEPKDRLGKRRPSEYFRDHWYVMFWFENWGPRHMLEEIGVKNVLMETDFPHPTCLYPNSREHFNDVLSDLDPYTRRRVLQDNAVELFHLPMPV